jgi:predicted GNAT superfamily acetyltransferase
MRRLPEKIIVAKGKRFLLRVEDSSRASDYQKYEDLRQTVWQFADDHLAGSRNLMCENFLHEGSSLFLGVYEEDDRGEFILDGPHLVGFGYGFAGLKDKSGSFDQPGNLWFYSQFLGVRPDSLNYGLGVMIKEFQKEVLLDIFHIDTVVCTYDPLTAVNAYRNVRHFGMTVLEYRIAPYGEYGGRLNRQDVTSDRFFMSWDLRRRHQPFVQDQEIADYLGRVPRAIRVESKEVRTEKGRAVLELATDAESGLDEEFILVQIPADYYLMLSLTDVEQAEVRQIPVNWRLETREIFLGYFNRGYQVVDFLRTKGQNPQCFYLLKRIAPAAASKI